MPAPRDKSARIIVCPVSGEKMTYRGHGRPPVYSPAVARERARERSRVQRAAKRQEAQRAKAAAAPEAATAAAA